MASAAWFTEPLICSAEMNWAEKRSRQQSNLLIRGNFAWRELSAADALPYCHSGNRLHCTNLKCFTQAARTLGGGGAAYEEEVVKVMYGVWNTFFVHHPEVSTDRMTEPHPGTLGLPI